MYNILILEDEIKTVMTISKGLSENGYVVDYALDGKEGLHKVSRKSYDLIISDVVMPNLDGIGFVQAVRQQKLSTPILMLSALGLTDDKINGFDSGCDDYLVKPFDFKELLARIKVLLKRSTEVHQASEILRYADLRLHTNNKEVIRSGVRIELTAKEYDLLEYLMLNKETVLTKEQIIAKVWDLDFDTGTNILEVYVSYLRNKIDKHFENKLIHTRKGIGYILSENE